MPILRPLASAGTRACWLLMGLCLGLPALANEAPVSFNGTSISLEQALERALRSNPELAAVGRETEIASGARQQAGLIPNPDLSWSVEDTRQGNRQTSVSIAQPLELGGKRGARVEVAKRGSEIAWTQLEVRRAELRAQSRADQARDLQRATLLRLRSEAVQAYDQLRTSEQELALVRRDLLPGAQSALDSMTRGFEMGKFNFLDVLDAQRTLVGVRAQYVRALDAAAQARVSMERLLGEDIGHLGQ